MKPEPTAEHRWLQRLAGEWTHETHANMGPDQPPHTSTGRESIRPLGELWVRCEWASDSAQGPGESVMTLGYDPTAKRFVGNFVSGMMAFHWVYSGTLDDAGKVLTLEAEGPSFTEPGKMVPYRDVIEITGDSTRTLTSHLRTPDGTWQTFMTMKFKRVG